MSDFDLKWFLIGALVLYLVQKFFGVLVARQRPAAS